jgi:hypothetical protein
LAAIPIVVRPSIAMAGQVDRAIFHRPRQMTARSSRSLMAI